MTNSIYPIIYKDYHEAEVYEKFSSHFSNNSLKAQFGNQFSHENTLYDV